jgi:hypothetical protein
MKTVILFLALAATAVAWSAADTVAPHTPSGRTLPAEDSAAKADVVIHTGIVGVFDEEAADNFFSIEARLRANWNGIRPWAGLTVVDNGAWFSGAGFIFEYAATDHLRLTGGTGPFYYSRGKAGDDLGLSLEFYSFAEASWAWANGSRIGLRLGHLSNAGLGRRNPGTETLSLIVSLPLDFTGRRAAL